MCPARIPISFLATDAPDVARGFYAETLGLELLDESPFALVFRDGDHELRVQIVPSLTPAPYTVHGWQVEDIKAEIRDLSARGVEFARFDGLPQDDLGIWTTPDGTNVAWFRDPSGNVLSLTQIGASDP